MVNSFKLFERRGRLGYFVAAAALVMATFLPAMVSADQVTERSIELSSSSVSAKNVTYTVKFTPTLAAGAFVVDFCTNSPVIGETCTAPDATFDATAAASVSSGFTDVTGSTTQVVVAGTMTGATPVSVAVTGVDNPATAGTLYARIVTYDTKVNATAYTSTDLGTGSQDQGGVAMAITPTIGVSGAVLETMTFCVAKNAITPSCANAAEVGNEPVLKLGKDTAGVIALDADDVYEGTINTQISTNAVNGAVINLKSSAVGCGGLINSSNPSECYIKPALATGIVASEAKFGVKTGVTSTTVDGTIQAVSGSNYSNAAFALNWVTGDATGVTSTYGDPFLDTDGGPANNKNMALTFGASVSNQTPAGSYSTDLSLIATGKF